MNKEEYLDGLEKGYKEGYVDGAKATITAMKEVFSKTFDDMLEKIALSEKTLKD